MKRRKWVALVLGGLGLVVVGLLLYVHLDTSPTTEPASAIYLEKGWLTKNATAENVSAIMARYHHPTELWLNGPGFRANQTFDTRNYGNFTAAVHEHSPGTKVLVFVNFATADAATDRVNDWGNATVRQHFADLIVEDATTQDWDGVVLDIEPIYDGNDSLPSFLTDLKARLPGKRIGLYAFRISDKSPSNYRWTSTYFAQVANASDFLIHALYNVGWNMNDEGFPASADGYQAYIAAKRNLTETLGLTNVYWGLPAYESGSSHNAAIENIGNAAPSLIGANTMIFYGMAMTNQDLRDYYAYREKNTNATH